MSPPAALGRLDRFERAVVAGAMAVVLVPVGLVASSLNVGLAHELHDVLTHRSRTCPEGMATALTPRRATACVPRDGMLPRGWILLA
jgi:hypothetical protein